MNELQMFEYKNSQVRTVNKGSEIWFVLKDVCSILELSNSRMVAGKLDDDEKGVSKIYTPGGNQTVAIINEAGLYSVILRSDKPEAKQFKRWVTHDVLPTIRKTGKYSANHPKDEDIKVKLAEAKVRNARAREASVWMKIANVVPIDNYKQVCASYASQVLAGEMVVALPAVEQKTYTATQIGDMLGVSSNMVGRIANEHHLKTDEYGKWYHDKAKGHSKEVESFRYYETVIPVLKRILQSQSA